MVTVSWVLNNSSATLNSPPPPATTFLISPATAPPAFLTRSSPLTSSMADIEVLMPSVIARLARANS